MEGWLGVELLGECLWEFPVWNFVLIALGAWATLKCLPCGAPLWIGDGVGITAGFARDFLA